MPLNVVFNRGMKKSYALIALAAALCTSSARAIEFRIVPESSDSDGRHSDLRARVRMLERAVEELQIKVFNLQAGQPPAQTENPKKWFCEMKAFTKTFKAFGPTKIETTQIVKDQCIKEYSEITCKEPTCQENN
jgi:hypothetical protein